MIGRNYVQGKTREEVIGKIGFSHFVVVDKNVAKKNTCYWCWFLHW